MKGVKFDSMTIKMSPTVSKIAIQSYKETCDFQNK